MRASRISAVLIGGFLFASTLGAMPVSPLEAAVETAAEMFVDDDGNVHEANIEKIAGLGITRGCNPPANDRFCPDQVVTRGELAAFLNRTLEMLPIAGETDPFTDDDDSIFERDIDLLNLGLPGHFLDQGGVTVGCEQGGSAFCPDDPIARDEFAVFLVDAFGFWVDDNPLCPLPLCGSSPDAFIDDDGSYYQSYINRMAALGITRGCNPPANDRFCPDQLIGRDQMATLLVNAIDVATEIRAPVAKVPTDCADLLSADQLLGIFGEELVLATTIESAHRFFCLWTPTLEESEMVRVTVEFELRATAGWNSYRDMVGSETSWRSGGISTVPAPAYADAFEPWTVFATYCDDVGHPPYCWEGSVGADAEDFTVSDDVLWDATRVAIEELWVAYELWQGP